ncbi:M16 family metallopeptidase [Spirilliplanes yamanashiensis]|uniref:Peptidase M16 C-terminal domain-containing protein n=1 Tax=Spirilliplanes yamanashiensis TaxID=42233 RepID=A0A8J3YDU1_9ACTN|nr:insulinase family protein [Spirilliplanes yamanashiensis]MDP9816599.1 putative Zn-dependent peptidase [Spirilliplanes yamanashiensis]GIJ06125.1 hypothetical protein Sya03_54770 [Spirilliplanes yamanashiensis]
MIKHTEVDGVPAILAPTSGQLHAGLVFRVGQADETLSRSGITHLLEHLTLFPLGIADYHFNGATGSVSTHFHMQGSDRDVATFITRVCASLAALPFERLAKEKEILRTEAAGRGGHVGEPMALWRHGARGYGLAGYPEWGLTALTPDDLRAWAATYFTRENAVLWIAGDEVPAGLRLDLPAGVRRPVPPVTSALPQTPAWFSGSSRATAWDAVVPRSAAAGVFTGVLERELFRALRQEDGLSYTAHAAYEPRGDGSALIVAVADALPEKADAVLGGFVDVLAKLKVGRIDPADVDAVVGKAADALGTAEADAARLPQYAFDMLVGFPLQTLEEAAADLRAVTPGAVAAVAAEALSTGLLMTPGRRSADWAGYATAPQGSESAVPGHAHRSVDVPGHRLVVGQAGVSLVRGDDVATVTFDACAAALAFPDGGRMLVGHDAVVVQVEPTLFEGAAAALPTIDAATAPVRVPMPARDPDDIPRPGDDRRADPRADADTADAGSRGLLVARLVVLWVLLVAVGGFTALLTLGTVMEQGDRAPLVTVLVFLYGLTALIIWGVVRGTRQLRRLRR